jgi:hypothetical protein
VNPVEVVVISGIFTIVGSTIAWFLARIQKRTDANTPGTPTVQEIWKRQDSMERALDASLVLLGQSVKQHDEPAKLVFSKAAVKTLRDTGFMPPELEDVLSENESN